MKTRQFSAINLRVGRAGGDHVLKEVERRMARVFFGHGKIVRLSGTEFIGIRYGNHGYDDNRDFAHRLVAYLERPVYWPKDGQMLMPTILMGISPGYPAGVSLSRGIQDASMAMFAAKRASRPFAFYSEGVRTQVESFLESENLLQDALVMDRLRYLIQPKVNGDETIVGGEVLMRLRGNDGDLIAPDRFIAIAERRGHIVALGESLLLSSAELLTRLPPTIHLAVNVSPVQLQYARFAAELAHILTMTGIDPARLELEITESAALTNRRTLDTLNAVKSMGVRLAIDDFGTNYSSLSHLRSIPADVLKIDRAFIADLDHDSGRRLLAGIVQIARALDLQVVAEGVETRRQADLLREMGCDLMQGYGFYKPMRPEAFQTLVCANRANAICVPMTHDRRSPQRHPSVTGQAHRRLRVGC